MKINTLFLLVVVCFWSCQSSWREPEVPVSEKTFIPLGGSSQYVEISGDSDKKPVLLFIHGGPGWPQTPQLRFFNSQLTNSFIVVTWDQRGCGLSYMKDSLATNVSLHQIVSDAHELTQLLKAKFKQKKIFLSGFSWGSVVGLTLVRQYPEDYLAYAGISQVVNLAKGMDITQKWLKDRGIEKKDTATLHRLEKISSQDPLLCPTPWDCFIQQYELVSKYGGAVFNPASDSAVTRSMSMYEDYKNYDWNQGFMYSSRRLEKDMFAVDFSTIRRCAVPVFLFAGRQDWNVPSVLAEDWFNVLNAPHKKMIWFENSGHGPLEEEPELFNKQMTDNLLALVQNF